MRCSLLVASLLAASIFQMAAGQIDLESFATPEFGSYTNDAQDVKVAFSLKAPASVASSGPLSLTMVLDRSSSMSGRKLELLQATNKFIVDKLAEEDGKHETGIVVYGDDVVDLVERQSVTSETAPLMKTAIDSMFASGARALADGIKRGVEQQQKGPREFSKNVFLFTDGLPTVGNTTNDPILREIERMLYFSEDEENYQPVVISTFAIGEEVDLNLMKNMARVGGGQAYFIKSEDDIPIAFGDALGGLLSTAAFDVNMFFTPINGVFIHKRPETRTIRTGGNITEFLEGTSVSYGNIFAEERRDTILELGVPDNVTEIMEVEVDFNDALSFETVFKDTIVVTINRTEGSETGSDGAQEPNPFVDFTDKKFLTSRVIEDALGYAKVANSDSTTKAITKAQGIVRDFPDKDDPTVVAMRKDLNAVKRMLAPLIVEEARAGAQSGRAPASSNALATAASIVEKFPIKDDPVMVMVQKDIEDMKTLLESGAVEAVVQAQAYARSGDANATATAVATAKEIVDGYPVKEDPTIAKLQKDIEEITKLLDDGAVKGDSVELAPQAEPDRFDINGTLRQTMATLLAAIREQRSIVRASGDMMLETNKVMDTASKKETREAAREAVPVGGAGKSAEPQPPSKSRKDGPGGGAGDKEGPAVLKTLNADGELVDVAEPAEGKTNNGEKNNGRR